MKKYMLLCPMLMPILCHASTTNFFLGVSGISRKPQQLQVTPEQLAKTLEAKDDATLTLYTTLPASYVFTDLQKSETLVKTALAKETQGPTSKPTALTKTEKQDRNASSIDALLTTETLLANYHIKADSKEVATYTKQLAKMDIDQLLAELNKLAITSEDVIDIAHKAYRLSNLDTQQVLKAWHKEPIAANRMAIFQVLKDKIQQLKPEILQRLRNLAIELKFKHSQHNIQHLQNATIINPTIDDVRSRMPAPFNQAPINSKEFEQQVAYINSLDRQGLIQEFAKRATTDEKRFLISPRWWRCAGDRHAPLKGSILMDLDSKTSTEEEKQRYRQELNDYIATELPQLTTTNNDQRNIIKGLRLRLVGMHFMQDERSDTKDQSTTVDHHAQTQTNISLAELKKLIERYQTTTPEISPKAFDEAKNYINSLNAQGLIKEFENTATTDAKKYALNGVWRVFGQTDGTDKNEKFTLYTLSSDASYSEETKAKCREKLLTYLHKEIPNMYNNSSFVENIQNFRKRLLAIRFMQ